ncbi:hypothetical protein CYMTET_54809 [Cymbomonas tetramitiformis]|uniref:LNR domain-containing protein n=1 Tax=Cymbomonas tetramitiformis TaxID=36881 RepID=A0AAE0BFD3_9CHLO|nr:hypothetical protein CYMTET_54809 [Cymbomonas tetramitiformis]
MHTLAFLLAAICAVTSVQCASPACRDSSMETIPCNFLLASGSGTGYSGDEGQGFFDGVFVYDAANGYFSLKAPWDGSKTCFLYQTAEYWILGTDEASALAVLLSRSPAPSPSCGPSSKPTSRATSAVTATTTLASISPFSSSSDSFPTPPPSPLPPPSPPSPPPPPSPSPPPPEPEEYAYQRSCSYTCRSKKNNGQCDGECNNPDCGFDGGDCCKASGGRVPSGSAGRSYPLVCQDPRYSLTDQGLESYRVDYHHPRCRKALRDQGSCGSCYAFAVATAQNLQMCKARHADHQHLIAPQYIESCLAGDRSGPAKPQQENCRGGTPWLVTQQLGKGGLGTEACYPYQYGGYGYSSGARWISCDATYNKRSTSACAKADKAIISKEKISTGKIFIGDNQKYDNDEVFEKIKAVLTTAGPMSFTFNTYESFDDWRFKYGPHLYPYGRNPNSDMPGSRRGGHAMTLMGYGEYLVLLPTVLLTSLHWIVLVWTAHFSLPGVLLMSVGSLLTMGPAVGPDSVTFHSSASY